MSCLSDSGWLRALDLRASTAAMFLACGAVFGLGRRVNVIVRILGLMASTLLLAPNLATAQSKTVEFQARAIEVLDDSATMLYHADYWITTVTWPVGKEGIPKVIRLGDVVTVGNRTLVANYIFVTQCLERMEWGGDVLCEKGQTTCTVVERPEDVPSDEERDRQWIYVKKCRPLGVDK
jgi:hypothetical protein